MIEKNHPPIKFGKTGVLIINLGTPDSTSWLDISCLLYTSDAADE